MQQNSQIAHRLHHHRQGKQLRTKVVFEQNLNLSFLTVVVKHIEEQEQCR